MSAFSRTAVTRSDGQQDTLALAAGMMPHDAYSRLAQGLFAFLNDWMMNLVVGDAVPAYNMYGLFRLADDLASMQALGDASQPPGLAVGASTSCCPACLVLPQWSIIRVTSYSSP